MRYAHSNTRTHTHTKVCGYIIYLLKRLDIYYINSTLLLKKYIMYINLFMIDVNRRELISACNCTNVFIHVHCLKEIGNTEHMLYCSRCKTRYPLEIRRKSLLKVTSQKIL